VNYAFTNGTNNLLQLRSGGTEVIAEARSGRNMTINLGQNNDNNSAATLTRASGATVNLVAWSNGSGTPLINLNFNTATTALQKGGAIPWATFGTVPRTAVDFAYNVAGTGSTAINSFSGIRTAAELENQPGNWGLGMNVSESGLGFSGTLALDHEISTLRFDTATPSEVAIGTGRTLSLSGGIGVAGGILVSSNTGSANKAITGGSLSGYSLGYAGDTTENGNVINNVSSTSGLRVGMPVSGNGIPAGTVVAGFT
jgi:hypothetical protein